ncbi:protein TOC75-3, chloroplastic-like isoform X1 [Phoenix dactylifera]|uniref:Protein TOC75-3, chloroplastic-like isoform X1 n=1 Tax=Phoenix dactylifera TaxID=42345 RepID=A0A8B9A802_PHODC|nr:protein TOC75-3, chloroplastic-like isoform X1 [Phoenix dactylifera]
MAFCAQKLPLGAQIPLSGSARHRRSASTSASADAAASAAAPVSAAHHPECVLSSAKTPSPKSPTNSTRKKTLALISSSALAAGGFLLHLSTPVPPPGNTGGGGGGGWGWGGFRGGDGGGFWSQIFSPLAAIAREEEPAAGGGPEWDSHGLPANIVVQLSKLSGFKRYKISEILFFDRRRATTVAGTEDSFFEMVSLRPGGVYTKAQLQKELETLASCGMFEKVDLESKTKPDGTLALTVSFVESTWQSADAFRCINVGLMPQTKQMEMDPDMTDREKLEYFRSQERDYRRRIERSKPCLLPFPVQREVLQMLREQGKVSARLLQRIRDRVQKWYHDEGYACAQVVNFGNLNTREVVCEVVEGDITQLVVQFQDKLGNVCEGNTQLAVVRRELPKQLRPGHVFNIEAGKQALRNINALALFSNIEVNPRPDEKNEGGIIVEIKLKELEQKSAEVSTEWSIVPGRQGRPTLASIQPGGTVSFEHRNIKGLNRSIVGSVTSSNLLNPQDDLSFKLEYVHPYVDGVYNPRNRTFRASCFNSRKLSPVFTGGPGVDEVPPVWIDRVGFKANITEAFTRQSKFTYGLVMEEITTRDETSSICTHGARALPTGGLSMDGPPTTLSGTGIDHMAFAQANITRDNTKFVNGAVVGERDVFQLDQGLGIGSKFPFFNRHQLTVTRFIPLKQAEEGAGKPPPPVLVLHGHYGGCVGDLPSYDAFTLGGPYSVRGYNMGELGACRNILELAAELRIPVRNTHVYAFAEHGNDLGSSKDVKGNPTEFFRRAGHGSSYGAGVKLGLVRAEYAVDHNAGTGAIFFRFGERFLRDVAYIAEKFKNFAGAMDICLQDACVIYSKLSSIMAQNG